MPENDALPRAITACSRCRSRKTKCDRLYPQCTSCAKAKVECAALDPATGRSVPRSYVSHLEDKIATLEKELTLLRLQSVNPSAVQTSDAIGVPQSSLSPSSVTTGSPEDQVLQGDKALSFAKMMFSAIPTPDATSLEAPSYRPLEPAPLPEQDTMRSLMHSYFNHSHPQVPIVSLDQIQLILQTVYSQHDTAVMSNEVKSAHYFTHIIAAIAYARDPSDARSEQHHASALSYLPTVFKCESRLSSLTAILLLTVYGTNRPSSPGIWYTLGIASRLITDLSLESQSRSDINSELERRLFWSWYVLDRQICVYLSRPTAIADSVIHCPLPTLGPVPEAFCKLRIMQSEIQRILHHSDTLPREYVSMEQWRESLNRRLEQWNLSRPHSASSAQSDFDLAFLQLNLEQTRLLLHGFSHNLPITPEIVSSSASAIIDIYHSLWLEDRVNFMWLAIHNVHFAASSFVYSLLSSSMQHPLHKKAQMLDDVKVKVEEMLMGMARRCPASLSFLESFGELVIDVQTRLGLLLSPQASLDTDQAVMSGPGFDEFMDLMDDKYRTYWDQFFAGDEFMFGSIA